MNPRRIAAAMLPAALLLCACSDDAPDPEVTPTPAASSSPTSNETQSTAPTVEPESSEEFAERWVDLLNALRETGVAGEFRSVSSKCAACLGFAQTFEQIYQQGGEVSGGAWHIRSTRKLDASDRESTLLLRLTTDPTRYQETADGPEKTLPGGRPTIRLILAKRGDEWRVRELFQESVS